MREETCVFGSANPLVGIITHPEVDVGLPTVILLNAGLIHRIGPNRVYVRLARHLAGLGFQVLRFDLSGIGDSPVRTDNLSFEKGAVSDAQQAMDYLKQTQNAEQFILMGHCAGAIHSFRVARHDDRVAGAVIINPQSVEQGWNEYDRKRKVANYYQNYYGKEALTDPNRWKKLFTGKADYGSIIKNVFQNILWNKISSLLFRFKSRAAASQPQPEVNPMVAEVLDDLRGLAHQDKPLLFVHSQESTGLERLKLLLDNELQELRDAPNFQMQIIPQADHTFTLRTMQDSLITIIQQWTETKFANEFVTGTI